MIKLATFSSILLLNFSIAYSQPRNREIVNQSLEWASIGSTLKMNKTIGLLLEGQFRYAHNMDPQQYQFRTALDIKLNEHISIVPLGYVYTWNYLYGKQPASFANNEHRVWQQISYKHTIGKFRLDHRVRFEERFIQVHSKNTNDAVVNEGYTNKQRRLRYRFMAKMPLNGSSISDKSYFLSVYEEAFISWGNKVTFHEPDQNRVFVGMGYQFDHNFSIQAGALYQMLIKSNGAKQENNVGLQVMVNYNIDLTKSGK